MAAKIFADRGNGKSEIGAAFVAFGGADADEGAAGGADFGTRLIGAGSVAVAAAAKEAAQRIFPAREAPLPGIGKCQVASLRCSASVPYNTGIAEFPRCASGRKDLVETMDKFEEFGRKMDEELSRLRTFVETELAPETEKRTAQFLREVSEKLTDAAGWLDKRRAARETEPAEKSNS